MTKIREYTVGDEPVPGYRLTGFLGSGGFGEVWKAAAPGGTQVAIKIINLGMKGALKEFRSLRLVKNIQYPNLVPILAIWLKDGQGNVLEEAAFNTMPDASLMAAQGTMMAAKVPLLRQAEPAELIIAMGLGQKSLADRLEECRKQRLSGIPVDELLNYLHDAARAIDYLNSPSHELELESGAIQHCDIKPPNILIVGDAAQVCDFSLARAVDDLRKTSLSLSPVYAAPEIIESNIPSPATDQYSLAVSYFELRTGELPFPAEATAHMVIQAHLNSKLDLSALAPAERAVIQRATARLPADRFASASDLILALRQAVSPPVRSRRLARPWWAAAALVLLVAPAAFWLAPVGEGQRKLRLPPSFVEAPGAKLIRVPGLICPDRIICTSHGLDVPFRFVHGRKTPAFYIMENKVSHGQFGRFVNESAEKMAGSKWESEDCGLPVELSVPERAKLPQFNVTCSEAVFFARWLGGESASLPAIDQWDASAGRFEPTPAGEELLDRGPLRQPWDPSQPDQIAIDRGAKGPLPVGTATHDVSVFGCRDMAGNGKEWTSTPTGTAEEFSPDHPDERMSMVLRGHDYTDPDPLRFKDLSASSDPQVQQCTSPDCQTSFRVVVRFDDLP